MKKTNELVHPTLRNKQEIDAFWEEHKDDEEVKLLTGALEESLKVFYLTEEEIKEKIKQIVCSRDIDTAQKLTYAIESLAINELDDFENTKDAEAVAKRKKFAKDALSALLDVHLTGCGEIRDKFFDVVDSAKTDFNINSMALAKKTLFSQATQAKYNRAVEAIFKNEKWEDLGIKFTPEEFKNMVEKCTTILYSAKKEVVNEVLDMLSQFSKDDEGHFVLNIKSLVQNCTSLLISSPKKLQETINFLNENYPRTDILESVRASGSILMVNPKNVKNYEEYLSICLEELSENYDVLAQKDYEGDAKKNCCLANLNLIDKMNPDKLENMHEITEVLIKNKIDPDTAYYAVKNLTITGQIDAKELDAFLCCCIVNEDKGGRELMNHFFNAPSLAIELKESDSTSIMPPNGSRMTRDEENVDASCGMTKDEARKKLQDMGKYFEGKGEKMFNLVTEKIKNRKKKPSVEIDPTTEVVDDNTETQVHGGKHKKKDGEEEEIEQKPAIVIPDFSDCADNLPIAEMANRVLKICDANNFSVPQKERKCLSSLKTAYLNMREVDKKTNFQPLIEFHKLSLEVEAMLKQHPQIVDKEQTKRDAAELYRKYLNSFRECKKELEKVEKAVRAVPEYRMIRDDLTKKYKKEIYTTSDGTKIRGLYRNTYTLCKYLFHGFDLVGQKLNEVAGFSQKETDEIISKNLEPEQLAHDYMKTANADNNLAIFRVAMNRSLLGVINTTNDVVAELSPKSSKNINMLDVLQNLQSNERSLSETKAFNLKHRVNYFNDVSKQGDEIFFADSEVRKFVSEMGFKNDYEFFVYTDKMVYSGEHTNGKIDVKNEENIYFCVPKTIDDKTLEKIGCTRLIGSPTGHHEDGKTK